MGSWRGNQSDFKRRGARRGVWRGAPIRFCYCCGIFHLDKLRAKSENDIRRRASMCNSYTPEYFYSLNVRRYTGCVLCMMPTCLSQKLCIQGDDEVIWKNTNVVALPPGETTFSYSEIDLASSKLTKLLASTHN